MLLVTHALIGFSLVSAPLLLVAYVFFLPHMEKTLGGRIACAALLLTLAALQLLHYQALQHGPLTLETRTYALLLMSAPTGFFFFSRAVLQGQRPLGPAHLLHLLVVLAAVVLPVPYVGQAAFVVGAVHSVWFLAQVWRLRRGLARFAYELFFFGLFAVMAVVAMLVVLLTAGIGDITYLYMYANGIGVALALVVGALLLYPELLSDFTEVAQLSYANSTLASVDADDRLAALERLLAQDRLFVNEDLNLATTAEALDLTAHQTSELINTHFGYGFSRLVREHRVEYAKVLLLRDPTASVLSVSMSAGFRSQSAFYAAFKGIVGMTPTQYREASSSS
ncbi:MAG: helix-turn-helix domain-containing protein [Pseudomonadota bacterium]